MIARPLAGRRLRGDQGAALVETALVTPVLMFLLFGIFEYGIIYRDYLTATDAAMEGAKVGSIMGPDPTTAAESGDFKIIEAIRQDMSNIPYGSIDRIVVFEVSPFAGRSMSEPLDEVPPACKTGVHGPNAGAGCNVYRPYDAFLAVQTNNTAYFECTGSETACGWPPSTRVNAPLWSDIEYVGVYIKIDRPMVTGMFGNTFEVEVASVIRLEPGALAS